VPVKTAAISRTDDRDVGQGGIFAVKDDVGGVVVTQVEAVRGIGPSSLQLGPGLAQIIGRALMVAAAKHAREAGATIRYTIAPPTSPRARFSVVPQFELRQRVATN
jgi:hypothetical protein